MSVSDFLPCRGYTSRFMAHVWATFALIFLAIYTANLGKINIIS